MSIIEFIHLITQFLHTIIKPCWLSQWYKWSSFYKDVWTCSWLLVRHWMNKELLLAREAIQLRMTVLPVKTSQSALNIYNKYLKFHLIWLFLWTVLKNFSKVSGSLKNFTKDIDRNPQKNYYVAYFQLMLMNLKFVKWNCLYFYKMFFCDSTCKHMCTHIHMCLHMHWSGERGANGNSMV